MSTPFKSRPESIPEKQRLFYPPKSLSTNAVIKSMDDYNRLYRESIDNPIEFWGRQAKENISWFKKWDQVLEYDFANLGEKDEPYVKYFSGAELNVAYNCLDRHLTSEKRNKAAIIWQGDNQHERRTLTYQQLYTEVCRFANVLLKHGVKKGDRVVIYLPMVPELAIAMLGCARIGAVHSVVFSAFSANALKSRIIDCDAKIVVTADIGVRARKIINLKEKVDTALKDCRGVGKTIVYQRGDGRANMKPGRDLWWHDETDADNISGDCEPVSMAAEDPLFLLYTSGSTGKPKGVLHTTAGYLLYVHLTFKLIFDIKDTDIYWCTADIGWITGHSYIVYGPLSNGATSLMFEGAPTCPAPDRFWRIIEDYKVNILYTAPTVIRALMRYGDSWPNRHDLSSLRILGTVGEPINPEAWLWYYRVIGQQRCPVIDTWWQTETGGIMITPLAAASPTKPGSATKPFFGVEAEVLRDDGSRAAVDECGALVITKPWPGMIRAIHGDHNNQRLKDVYFGAFPQKYLSGDRCRIDKDGFFWLMGRDDDVINVSAHRLATAEIENVLVSDDAVAEAAVVGIPHPIKGQAIYCYVTLNQEYEPSEPLKKSLIARIRNEISPIATPDGIQFTDSLPKTRSGKIMRRILRKIASGKFESLGDTSTLADSTVIDSLIKWRQNINA